MTAQAYTPNTGPLAGIRVLDLSRVLAGPTATQILGDLGADVVKVERPGHGDDTRKWGPPFLKDSDGNDSSESSYYLCANRNKRSIAVDIADADGQETIRKLLGKADILIENFRVGALTRYGLGYDDLKDQFPGLIYCSLTGFGQTGPYAGRGGYDFMIQGLGGIMSLTGPADGEPSKVGVAVADIMAGMYATTAILAALHHRDKTGEGQFIDISLLDTQVSWLANNAQSYLTSGQVPPRVGNAHPSIVPYEAYRASDEWLILAVGNDSQFEKFCDVAGRPELAFDERFATNPARVRNRKEISAIVAGLIATRTRDEWLDALDQKGVPCGPVNNMQQVFADKQVQARDMTINMTHPVSPDPVTLIGSPIKMSKTPVSFRRHPPMMGEHTEDVLEDWLGEDEPEKTGASESA